MGERMMSYEEVDDALGLAHFDDWLSHAKRGGVTAYFTGEHMLTKRELVTPEEAGRRPYYVYSRCSAGVAAYTAYERGLVVLTQRRLRPGVFEYLATRV